MHFFHHIVEEIINLVFYDILCVTIIPKIYLPIFIYRGLNGKRCFYCYVIGLAFINVNL